MAETLPKTISELKTPCLLIDLDIVKKNCQRMIESCKKLGVELRPHMKTHKTVEGAELMTGGTKRKMVVSTMAEAEFYAKNGFDDILYGSPMVKEKLPRCVGLANTLNLFHLMIDSVEGMDAVIATPLNAGKKWSIFLELDCGFGRTGALWDSDKAFTIAKKAWEADNVIFQGLYTHCGNSYNPNIEQKVAVQKVTTERLISLKERLSNEGIECKIVGTGSTPSCSKPQDFMGALTEFHPGNYIFNDNMQVMVNSCGLDDVACRVMTTVISHKPEVNTLVVDAGFTALGWDGFQGVTVATAPQPLQYFPVIDHPELRLVDMCQELGKIKPVEGQIDYSKHPLGQKLCLLPWHSCDTASQHPVYYIHSGENVVGAWYPTRGW